MRRIAPRKLLSVSLIVVLLFLPALFTLCVVSGRLAYLDRARRQGRGHHDVLSACAESGRAPI